MLAACRDDYSAVQSWLEGGGSADAHTGRHPGFTLLTAAAQGGNRTIIDLVLRHNGSVDERERDGKTALFYAAEAGEQACVRRLLQACAAVNVQDSKSGWTALMCAVGSDHRTVTDLLLRASADVTLQNAKGRTAQWYATPGADCASLLEQHSRSPLAPLRFESDEPLVPEAVVMAATLGDLRAVAAWLSKPNTHIDARARDVEDSDFDGDTLLRAAATEGQVAVVRALLQRKATVDLAGDDGETALMLAAREGHVATAKLLLDHQASPDVQGHGEDFPTALILASSFGYAEIVQLLLKHNASVDLIDENGSSDSKGMSALMLAAQNGQVECMRLLLSASASVHLNCERHGQQATSALEEAATFGELAAVQLLLDAGAAQLEEAIEAAKEQGHRFVVRAIQQRAKVTVISVAGPEEQGPRMVQTPHEPMHASKRDFWLALKSGGFRALREEELDEMDFLLHQSSRVPTTAAQELQQQERRRADAAAELAMHRARLEQQDEALRRAEHERAAQRRACLAAERAARAAREDGAPLSQPGPSHRDRKPKAERPLQTAEEQLSRQRWAEEKPLRAQAFADRQASAHEQAVERCAAVRRAKERRNAAYEDMNRRAREHVVPPPNAIAEHVHDAMRLAAARSASAWPAGVARLDAEDL